MIKINFDTREKIIKQALDEITFARDYKQGKTKNWSINETLYYSKKFSQEESRANVDLGKMGGFVHTIMSKIDEALVFKFTKRKESQLARVKILNSLKNVDQDKDFWDIKDLAGKKQAIIYGRAIYSYYADSIDKEYKPHLENVDVYDFLIDPSAGGIDIERARYLGRYGVIKSRSELKDGVKDGLYLKTETTRLIEGSSNATSENQEELNKTNRTQSTNVYTDQKEISGSDKYKFWEWYTTYEGKRYYLLLNEDGGTAVRVEELSDLFTSNLWPFWTWAAFVDLTEFWGPSYCDYVREVFMAQAVSINQALDNAEQINKPQKVVNVGAVENLAELKYRRDGYIKVKKDFDANKAVQPILTPSITTPFQVYDVLEAIQEKASGITAGAQGAAENDAGAKATIYQGNQANSADRFGLLNKTYSFGYKRFAKLYEWGIKDHLVKKVAVDILGPEGIEVVKVSRRDIFRKDEEFGCIVESSTAELALSEEEKKTKLTFLASNAQNPIQNPQKAYELSATIVGFDEDTIRQLQDSGDFGDAKIMSEAERDIEKILDGEIIPPNTGANTAYKQRFVDYMRDHQNDLTPDQFEALATYVESLQGVIMQNMITDANRVLFKQKMAQVMAPTPEVAPSPEMASVNNSNGDIIPR